MVAVLAATGQAQGVESRSKLRHAGHVITFFNNHSWMLAKRHTSCDGVEWKRTCIIARGLYRDYTWQRRHLTNLIAHGNVVARLNRGLSGTPMAGTGKELEQAARREGIHPAFIAAIAGTESSFGETMCGNYNAYGLGNCSGIWNVPRFRTWAESYDFMAKYLANRWPSANSTYEFYGYAACDACWGRKTAMWMRTRFGAGPTTSYK